MVMVGVGAQPANVRVDAGQHLALDEDAGKGREIPPRERQPLSGGIDAVALEQAVL
jgi:hypothetical protein